jgi:hypothetical protein
MAVSLELLILEEDDRRELTNQSIKVIYLGDIDRIHEEKKHVDENLQCFLDYWIAGIVRIAYDLLIDVLIDQSDELIFVIVIESE